jgi:Putative quorum-sensing-regulated virulence factor
MKLERTTTNQPETEMQNIHNTSEPVLLEALTQFMLSFELAFDEDWDFSALCLAHEEHRYFIKPEEGTFLNPKVEVESSKWGNRGTLLSRYRELVKAMKAAGAYKSGEEWEAELAAQHEAEIAQREQGALAATVNNQWNDLACAAGKYDDFERLEESNVMPFGKHQGKLLREIPAMYFRWLWIEAHYRDISVRREVYGALADYIERHLDEFRKRTPKYEWPDVKKT